MGDGIEVPLDLSDFEVTESRVVGGAIEVEIVSTRRPACCHCGSVSVFGHGRNVRRIRDRSVGRPTVLLWTQRRVKCSECGRTSRERHSEIAGRRSITERFRHHLFERAVHESFAHVAATEAVSSYRVIDAFDWHSLQELTTPLEHQPEVICVDESATRKRYRYHTLLFDPGGGGAFDAAEGRSQGSAEELLARLSPQARAHIRAAVIDLHCPYRKALELYLPDAAIVADKFHVVVAISKAANLVRRRTGRNPSITGKLGGTERGNHPRFDREVLDTKWIFMKRIHRLTAEDRGRLDSLFARFPEMGVAWLMRETFLAIYDAPNKAEAERRLEIWIAHLPVAGVPEITKVWTGLFRWWREPILAQVEYRWTNAFAEGLTNRIKVLKRISFGFSNQERYRRKVLLACGRRRDKRGYPPSFP